VYKVFPIKFLNTHMYTFFPLTSAYSSEKCPLPIDFFYAASFPLAGTTNLNFST
jgi:hypothetical protein